MCPFCYIGKRHYEAALRQFSAPEQLDLQWMSFQLDPGIPQDIQSGMTSAQYLANRKGISLEHVREMHARVEQMAEAAGLEYHLDRTQIFNSFKAHRIIQKAKENGMGDQAEELFFRAHFTQNLNLGNEETLTEISKELGMDKDAVKQALRLEKYADKVRQDIYQARQVGVQGVPFFVFNDKIAVSGAQPPQVFLQSMEKAFADWKGGGV